MVFLSTLGLLMSAAYFLVQAPLQKRKLKARLEAVQQVSLRPADADTDILRREMLSDVAALNKILINVPAVLRLQLFLQQAAIEMQVVQFLLIAVILTLFAFVAALVGGLPIPFAVVVAACGGSFRFSSRSSNASGGSRVLKSSSPMQWNCSVVLCAPDTHSRPLFP